LLHAISDYQQQASLLTNPSSQTRNFIPTFGFNNNQQYSPLLSYYPTNSLLNNYMQYPYSLQQQGILDNMRNRYNTIFRQDYQSGSNNGAWAGAGISQSAIDQGLLKPWLSPISPIVNEPVPFNQTPIRPEDLSQQYQQHQQQYQQSFVPQQQILPTDPLMAALVSLIY
jgi:hypothetical protein